MCTLWPGCTDYARLDIRIREDKKVFVLEVNPNPDLTEGVSFMDSAEHFGLSFGETLAKIVECALSRPAPSVPVMQKTQEQTENGKDNTISRKEIK